MHDPQRPPPLIPLDADPDEYRWANDPFIGPISRRGAVWMAIAGVYVAAGAIALYALA